MFEIIKVKKGDLLRVAGFYSGLDYRVVEFDSYTCHLCMEPEAGRCSDRYLDRNDKDADIWLNLEPHGPATISYVGVTDDGCAAIKIDKISPHITMSVV
jgi:hypothetical protein